MERGGKGRSFHIDRATKDSVQPIVRASIARETGFMTNEIGVYINMSRDFGEHLAVVYPAGEYARGDAHTNRVEGYFSILKRGLKGIYQHCGEDHLLRYLAEHDFRYNRRVAFGIDDHARRNIALGQVQGKRLTYQRISAQRPFKKQTTAFF